MNKTISEISKELKGKIVGDSNIIINKLSKIEEANYGSISFISKEKYLNYLYTTNASAIIISSNLKFEKKKISSNLIIVNNAYQSFAELLNKVSESKKNIVGIHKSLFKEKNSTIGKNCFVGANVYIGNNVSIGNNVKIFPNTFIGDDTFIGNNCIIYPGVKIHDQSIIGENCIIQSGVNIGGDGFGFTPNSDNQYSKIAHIGNVIIENNVEIGANTTIDRATLGSTIIRKGVKLDNLIQIAHNVEIGKNTVIAAQSGIAGSTKIGENCMIGGQVGIIGHLKIGNNVKIAAQSGVSSNINDNEIIQGSPAFLISEYKKSYIYFKQLPKLNAIVNKLEKLIN